MTVDVYGAGLAGCEAAWQLAERGIDVNLYEMKPNQKSPAHKSDKLAELVCSNSLRGAALSNAVGLLKEEMRRLSSLVIEAADATKVPAGGALAVDRDNFSEYITNKIKNHPKINLINQEVTEIAKDRKVIIATGPLSSDAIANSIKKTVHAEYLSFYDAAAPIVTLDSLDFDKVFKMSRYGKGGDDYINCPMNREEYFLFYNALLEAETAEIHEFENEKVFEGCMPIETMASRGLDVMRFGPLKPVGLIDPNTGKEPYAVVQLRQDNAAGTLFNLVGFQTHLKFGEQKRVFGMIPGLEKAEFARYGVMHRNTYINSPKLLNNKYRLINNENIIFAGQITGVEGYVESSASGLLAARMLANDMLGDKKEAFSKDTAIGALAEYIANKGHVNFQPMNINFGIMNPIKGRYRKRKEKREAYSKRALEEIDNITAKG